MNLLNISIPSAACRAEQLSVGKAAASRPSGLTKNRPPAFGWGQVKSGKKKDAGTMPMDELMNWYDAVIQFGRVAQHPLNKRLAMESLLSGYPGN